MIGFRITVNAKDFCESDDLTAFTMVVEDLRNSDEQRVSLHAQAGDGPLQWLAANLKVGDTVKIEVVDLVAEAESDFEELQRHPTRQRQRPAVEWQLMKYFTKDYWLRLQDLSNSEQIDGEWEQILVRIARTCRRVRRPR